MQLRRLKCARICRPQAGGPGKPVVSHSETCSRRSDVQDQEKMGVAAQEERKFALPPSFCPNQALSGLAGALPHWFGQISLPIQMLTSSQTPSQTNPEIVFYQLSGRPLAPSS